MISKRLGIRFFVSVSILGMISLGVAWSVFGPSFSYVQIHGQLSEPEREVVAQAIRDSVKGSLFVTPNQVAQAVTDLGWTTDVRVWRKSKERIVVAVQRKDLAVAVDDREFITSQGEVIFLPDVPPIEVPRITTPNLQVDRALDVVELVNETGERLGLHLVSVSETVGTGWKAEFEPGFQVVIGGTDLVGRLDRFGVVYAEALATQRDRLLRIDARYDHGIAVAWQPNRTQLLAEPETE